jgi:hypothetical protein
MKTIDIGEYSFEVEHGMLRCWHRGTYPQRHPEDKPIDCCTPCSRVPVSVVLDLVRALVGKESQICQVRRL